MKFTNINSLWAATIVEELASAGVTEACLTPGGRSTPLTVAFAHQDGANLTSHFDERSASYFALGAARAGPEPVAVVTTSGTAAAELHPAVLEAYHSRIPLILLTADRPPELRKSGANQTIDQADLFGSALRHQQCLPEPSGAERTFRSLRTIVDRSVHRSMDQPSGPVHLNVPFKKPLEPGETPRKELRDLDRGRSRKPYIEFQSGRTSPSSSVVQEVVRRFRSAERPVVFAGPRPFAGGASPILRFLCSDRGIPLLADPLSGERYSTLNNLHRALSGYEHFLSPLREVGREPDFVLRFGASPNASDRLNAFLSDSEAPQVLVSDRYDLPESEFRAERSLNLSPRELLRQLVHKKDQLPNYGDWNRTLTDLDRLVNERRKQFLNDRPEALELNLAQHLIDTLAPGSPLFVANSSPIRDFVQFTPPSGRSLKLTANRGTSGIDGQLATAAGLSRRTDKPVTALVGDVSFLHDLGSLASIHRNGVPIHLIVINNAGGGIFHRLPVEQFDPPFEDYVKTAHSMDFAAVADQFDAKYHQVEHQHELAEGPIADQPLLEEEGLHITEVRTDGERNQRLRESLNEHLAQCLTESEHL